MSFFQPLVIVGASGAGKGTIVKYLLSSFPQIFKLSVSWTTRIPRVGEQNGREYYFMTHEKFQEEIQKNAFIEYCHVFSNIYGTHKSQVDEIMAQNKICILEIDIQGAKKVSEFYPQANYLFISVKDTETLEQRLRARKTDSEEQIQQRLQKSIDEINDIKESQLFSEIQNDVIEKTYQKVEQFLKDKYVNIDFKKCN